MARPRDEPTSKRLRQFLNQSAFPQLKTPSNILIISCDTATSPSFDCHFRYREIDVEHSIYLLINVHLGKYLTYARSFTCEIPGRCSLSSLDVSAHQLRPSALTSTPETPKPFASVVWNSPIRITPPRNGHFNHDLLFPFLSLLRSA